MCPGVDSVTWGELYYALYVTAGPVVAVTAGAMSTRGLRSTKVRRGGAPRPPGWAVTWDPGRRLLARTPGPLVYLVRQWDGTTPLPLVKVGYTGVPTPGAASARIGDWETGTPYPTRVEGLVPGAPESLERALHRALTDYRTSSKREWFALDHGDQVWRDIVEATCRLHQPGEAAR